MRYILPDYTNCCVNLMNSISQHFGLKPTHPTLPVADEKLKRGYKNVVVLLLDGFGQNLLMERLPFDSFLRTHFVQELSAVYPSSTVPATVSFKTGLTPLEHGWWSHFLYFKMLGQTINVYTNNDAYSRKSVPLPDVAHRVMPYTNILDLATERNGADFKAYVLCEAKARDDFGVFQVTYNTFDEMSEYITTLTSLGGRRLIYAYHSYPDEKMHKAGVRSDETDKLLIDLNYQVENLCKSCPDTLFFITADHGQTELRESRDLLDYPDLFDCLTMLPNGCTRCANLYVKRGREREFEKLTKKYFGDKFILFSRKEVLEKGLLGVGKPHVELDNTLGDYLLCATGDCNLVSSSLYGQPSAQPLGIHGGLTLDEMRVPLIIYGDRD